MPDFTAAVAKGAALLDDDKPDWFNLIEVSRLDMASDYRCILAQVYGTFEAGCKHFGWNMEVDLLPSGAVEVHGFNVDSYLFQEELAATWIECIRQRKLAVINS